MKRERIEYEEKEKKEKKKLWWRTSPHFSIRN